MKKYTSSLALIISSLFINAQTINKTESKVEFEISNMGVKTVEGTFTGMEGTVVFNESDLKNSNFNVCVSAGSINTESEKRDEHLKNEDFFEVVKFPNICFESSAITKTDDGYLAKGKLTMHGITLEASLPFTYSNKTFTGGFELERDDYKIGEDYGGFMVGKTVEIKITCILN